MELQRYLSVVRRRLWLIALIVVVGCAAAGYYASHTARPEYQASARLLIYAGGASDKPGAEPDAGAISSSILLIKTYKQIVLTPRVLKQVAAEYPDLHTSEAELGAKVSVSSVAETQIMTVSATDASYERAARMANAVSSVFQQEVRSLLELNNVKVLDWADPEQRVAPASSGAGKLVAIAFVLSAMIGTGLAFLLDRLDESVRTDHDVRVKLNLPLLADVPRIRRRDLKEKGDLGKPMNAPGRKSHVTLDA